MSRYIDVDELLENMRRHRQHSVPFEYIKSLTPAHVAPAPKWISVKERLPEVSGRYLTISPNGIYGILNYSAKYRAFNIFDEQSKSKLKYCLKVTHWQPLPEPPKEEGDPT